MALRVLATFPGKFGDSLWMLPTLRAISQAIDAPVDLLMAERYSAHHDLLRLQPYVGQVFNWPFWQPQDTAPLTPWSPFEETLHFQPLGDLRAYDHVVHLGYREWPTAPLPYYVYHLLETLYPVVPRAPLDLATPWLLAPWGQQEAWSLHLRHRTDRRLAVGFTDEWFELKYGLAKLLERHTEQWSLRSISGSPRWYTEAGEARCSWLAAAEVLAQAEVFVGCCSALHVLAVALGIPVVCMEPNPDRHHPIFWPFPQEGPQVRKVRGNDGHWTFDARHVAEAIEQVLCAS